MQDLLLPPLERLKVLLSEYGYVTHKQNGQSFRLIVKLHHTLPRFNNAVADFILQFFRNAGMSVRIGVNKDNVFAEWEIPK
jgi:hypothetical protein